MAFQTGSQVRPELADADYSGFQNAANIQANAMANFGESIASGIEGYKKKKKEDKLGQAKINRSIAFGESLIEMTKDSNRDFANSIADQLAINFGENVPFDQRVAATDGLNTEITNMFLLNQRNQAPTYQPGPEGGMVVTIGGEPKYFSPYQMGKGSDPTSALMDYFGNKTTPTTPIPAPPTPDDLEEEARLLREQGLTQ